MTGPLIFEAIPTPDLDDACDGVLAFRDISLRTDANFERVRLYDPAFTSTVSATSIQTAATPSYTGTVAAYFNVPNFPTATITLPTPVSALVVFLSAQLVALGTANTLEMSALMTGTGLTAALNPATTTQLAARNLKFDGTRSWLIPRASLIAGGDVIIQAQMKYSGTNVYIQTGAARLLALRGW